MADKDKYAQADNTSQLFAVPEMDVQAILSLLQSGGVQLQDPATSSSEADNTSSSATNSSDIGMNETDFSIVGVRVPLTSITVDETQLIPYVEALGAMDTIVLATPYLSSPCLQQQAENFLAQSGEEGATNSSEADLASETSSPWLAEGLLQVGEAQGGRGAMADMVRFVGGYGGDGDDYAIQFAPSSELGEGSALAASEWIKFFAPLFQKDCEAQEMFEEVRRRYVHEIHRPTHCTRW